ncbi:aminotransferase class I/II-fold pyridoxal phosphate-dependent enzyme [Leuconostocaceae bacterium ESL0723]|nr:aminotransferase class I/II-fold pyridoxal phosphate-dependent enzyme [Leuconostocaceae bacterium ESL0723]
MPDTKPAILDHLNQRLNLVKPSAIRAFDNEVSPIPGILKLTLGEPDFDVPEHAKQAAVAAIEANDSHYSASNGKIELRRAIAGFLADRYGLHYQPESEIVVTTGATEAIYDSLTALLNPGDKVLIPTPAFPLYTPVTVMAGGEPIYLNTEENGFVLRPEQLQAAIDQYGDEIKAIVLNYPSNPTGVVYSEDEIKALADILKQTDIVVISDEIYAELSYGDAHTSIAKFLPDQTLVLNGVSKSHAMTGYRIGFVAGPAELIKRVGMVHQFATTTASNPAMVAATEALSTVQGKQDSLDMREAYRERRDYLYKELTDLGFEIPKPDGAFYIFAKIPADLDQDDLAFSRDLAKQNKLAFVPGSFFGPGGESYVRLSYAASMDNLKEAVKRLTAYVEDQRAK